MSKTLDLFAFTGVEKTGRHRLVEALFTNGGSVCTGIQKLIQDWLLLMLTPKGSLPFDKNRGCNFLPKALNARTESSITEAFIFGNAEVVSQLKRNEPENLDEQIKAVSLNSININGGTISISATITSNAGDSREVVLPITSNPVIL